VRFRIEQNTQPMLIVVPVSAVKMANRETSNLSVHNFDLKF